MCLTMIPFSLITLFLEIKTNNFKFEINLITILLLILAGFIRYIKQRSFVGCYRKLQPFEFKTYMSVTLIICFLIDLGLGIQTFNIFKVISIILILLGLLLVCNIKLNIKNIGKELILRILSDVIMGYIIYILLKYWSNGIFILILNLLLVIIFTPIYKPYKNDKINMKMFGLILLQQTFGFSYTYMNNYLSSISVTLSSFVSPISLILISLTAIIINKDKRPNLYNFFGIIMVAIGILLINSF